MATLGLMEHDKSPICSLQSQSLVYFWLRCNIMRLKGDLKILPFQKQSGSEIGGWRRGLGKVDVTNVSMGAFTAAWPNFTTHHTHADKTSIPCLPCL